MPKNKYKKLSIIMPCYNCDSTLKEAIGSVYTQNFNMPYEIIMIDDGSCDNTKNIIKKYAKNDSHIKDFYHDKNQGGTATFDNAVKKATGDVIFCLDSDNVLAPNTLPKMFEYLNKKNADGVAIYERRFFCGKNKKKYKTHINKIINKPIELGDLFNEHNALLDQFMFIKKRYYQAGGHPTHHGFAGQCFERRFLSKGFKVYTCPDTIFYHRQGDEKSWYTKKEFCLKIFI